MTDHLDQQKIPSNKKPPIVIMAGLHGELKNVQEFLSWLILRFAILM